MIVPARKLNPRIKYRLRRAAKINNSPSLSEQFPKLKTLNVTLDYLDATNATRSGALKYKVNLAHGKALFCFDCVNRDCARGDYNLSKQLAEAIAARRKIVEGDLRCRGTRHNKECEEDRPCHGILHYKLTLGY